MTTPHNAYLSTALQIPSEQYHAETGHGDDLYATRSSIFLAGTDPEAYEQRYMDKEPLAQVKDSAAMKLGRDFESYLLEGARCPDHWVVRPDGMKYSTKEGKLWREEQEEDGCAPHDAKDFEIWEKFDHMASRMKTTKQGRGWDAMRAHDDFRHGEVIRYHDPETGVRCQVQLDGRMPGLVIPDLKTSGIPQEKFTGHAEKMGYHLQAWMYPRALAMVTRKLLPFVFPNYMTVFPFHARVRRLPPIMDEWAERIYTLGLKRIASNDFSPVDDGECMVTDPMVWQTMANETEEGGAEE